MTQRELIRERVSYLTREMGRLYVLGHEIQQCAEYEATERLYHQALVDSDNCEKFVDYEPLDPHTTG